MNILFLFSQSRHASASDLQPPLKKSRLDRSMTSPHSSITTSKHSSTPKHHSTAAAAPIAGARKHSSSQHHHQHHHLPPPPAPAGALNLPAPGTPSLQPPSLQPPSLQPPSLQPPYLPESMSRDAATLEAHKRMLSVMENLHKPISQAGLHPSAPHTPLHLSLPPPGLGRGCNVNVPSSPSLIDKLKHTRPEDAPMFPTFLGLTPPTSTPAKSLAPPTMAAAAAADKPPPSKHAHRPDLLPPSTPTLPPPSPIQHPSLPPMPQMPHHGLLNLGTPPTGNPAPHVPPIPGMPSLQSLQHGFPGL